MCWMHLRRFQHPWGWNHTTLPHSLSRGLSEQSSLPYPDLTAVISWCEQPTALPSARGRLLSSPGFPPLCHAGVCVLRVGCAGSPGLGRRCCGRDAPPAARGRARPLPPQPRAWSQVQTASPGGAGRDVGPTWGPPTPAGLHGECGASRGDGLEPRCCWDLGQKGMGWDGIQSYWDEVWELWGVWLG